MIPPLHITQHKRFVYYGIYPNPSLPFRTSFMLGTIDYELEFQAYSEEEDERHSENGKYFK